MEEQLIQIEITTPEAIAFRQFMQFHSNFMLLVNNGVFNVKDGSVRLHFDHDGNVRKIEREDTLYNERAQS